MVAISHAHKFIFIKTTKTASTTVEMLLQPLCTPPGHPVTEASAGLVSDAGIIGTRLNSSPIEADPKNKWPPHMPARKIRRRLGRDMFNDYAKIITVRNPFTRAVSQLYWSVHNGKLPMPQTICEAREVIRRKAIRAESTPGMRRHAFINDRYIADYAIRQEHLAEDIDDLATKLSLPISSADLVVTKDTSKKRPPWALPDYFDAETVDRLNKTEDWIFEKFGYARDPALPVQSSHR